METEDSKVSAASAKLRELGLFLTKHPHRRTLGGLAAALLATVVLVSLLLVLPPPGQAGAPFGPTPTPRATQDATSTPDPHALDWLGALQTAADRAYADDLISHLSVDEEIGQLLVTDFLGTTVDGELLIKLQQYHIGGAILYNRNFYSAASLRKLTSDMQANSKIPMIISIDQEGGTVNRLAALDGYQPSAEAMAAKNDPAYVRSRGQADGQLMYSVGINMNLAPVVDVQGVPDGQTYMSYRMFGWTPDKVTTMAGAYLEGEQEGRHVVGVLKHFPGLGGIAGDPHQALILQNRSVDEMEKIDWAPYRALFATGQVDAIMTTHITVAAVDPTLPTTISNPVTTGILRNRLGFTGVIMTDDIYMTSLATGHSFAQRVIGSVLAGNDLICSVFTLDATAAAVQILRDAVKSGTITKARLDESVRRILMLKLKYGILARPQR